MTALHIYVKGLVQGVGFRPFIFLLAKRTGVHGWVRNTSAGVEIFAEAPRNVLADFVRRIRKEKPPASFIETLRSKKAHPLNMGSFTITDSEIGSDGITHISPDIAVCDDCLNDMEDQPHRHWYPFVNCTNCGPRYSIIRDLPYDRSRTSMDGFTMCSTCEAEYRNIEDRRFHTQPVACRSCGPSYELIYGDRQREDDIDRMLKTAGALLLSGKIVAIKGVGGFHLACDAFNENAVRELRARKQRDGKPFAVMFRDINTLSLYAKINRFERRALISWRRPIVILDLIKKWAGTSVLSDIHSGLRSIGAFLPYMPIHYLLFRHFSGHAIVLTSGNRSGEPIVKDNEEALTQFRDIADAFLIYNRTIVHRTDDSVVRVIGSRECMVRRSRGFVPEPVTLSLNVNNLVSFGAELSSSFCVGRNNQAIPGPYIGDLKSLATHDFYEESLHDFLNLFRVKPELLACDMHPGYFSTRLAEQWGDPVPLVRVQHHHAHIASCMGEHGLDERVIGVALDGTGYGDDGKIWGGEFLLCDLADYKRIFHFDYIPLPGGDKAVEEPWRTAIAYLYRVFGSNFTELPLNFLDNLKRSQVMSIIHIIDQKLNCPEVSSVGRLFDAVAAMINLCMKPAYQAEAPMKLESLVLPGCGLQYSYTIDSAIHVDGMIREIVGDLMNNSNLSLIATKFHNTIISIIFDSVIKMRTMEKTGKVILSGGVFQNRYLLEGTERLLKQSGFRVFSQSRLPSNDGGIAFGQMVVAAKRRSMKCV